MVDDKSIGGDGKSIGGDGSGNTHNINPVYALSNQDGTGARITHVQLTGPKTYAEWAKGFRVALGAKRKLGFIDGTLRHKPSNPTEYADWEAVNYTIIAWIFNTIAPGIRSSISYRDTAFDLWEDIRKRFSVANDIKIYQLQGDLAACKQKPGESLMDYFGRIKLLWDDINDYDVLPNCECCSKCDLQGTIRKRREVEQVRGFLMGLDPVYANVRSSILGSPPLPDIHIVYSRIAQEEDVRTIAQAREEAFSPMACAVHGKGPQVKNENGSRPRFKCTHCNKD
ncbi:uncharacterized protein LOC141626219 [Silene latifolia]|uniref:uncharacterized protein LOC141626219 n=1 Tax=Silene latifolia TaxID=37657 RepID=UPI003D78939A